MRRAGGLAALGLLSITVLGAYLYLSLSPQFGGSHSDERMSVYAKSGNHRDGKFVNQIPTDLAVGPKEMAPMLWEFFFADIPDKEPAAPLPVEKIDPETLEDRDPGLERLTWFGHSACLLEIDGKKILFDPMFSGAAAPVPGLAPKRFNGDFPVTLEELPAIDAVVISHDHFDHLDYPSIRKLMPKTARFLVPLGVGAHLARWGVEPERIAELDWGDSVSHAGMTFICAPARHFSGRGLFDRFRTLWASWVIKTRNRSVYNSGDSGYGPHFQAIGKAYGPFDLVMMECGQYDERWSSIHMMAREAVRATAEVGGKLMLPIHWGAFALAMHSWYDPIEKVTAEARKAGIPVTTPKIGEPVLLGGPDLPESRWWTGAARSSSLHPEGSP